MPDGLYEIAATEGIGVNFANLPSPILGLYDSRPGEAPLILLHEKTRNNRRLLRCIFAEEVGHHFTCAKDIMAFAQSTKYVYNKYDHLALLWATKYLVPLFKLLNVINSERLNIHHLANYFDVTERFVAMSISIYSNKYEDKLKEVLANEQGWLFMETCNGGNKSKTKNIQKYGNSSYKIWPST